MSDAQFDSSDRRLQELEAKVNRGEDLSPEEEAELDQIVARFQDEASNTLGLTTEKAKEKAGDIHAEFDTKLRELENKARQAKARESVKVASKDAQMRSDAESARGLGVGLSIAYVILGTPLLGLGIGWLLDNRYESTAFKGIGTISGAVLGIGIAFWMMNRTNGPQN